MGGGEGGREGIGGGRGRVRLRVGGGGGVSHNVCCITDLFALELTLGGRGSHFTRSSFTVYTSTLVRSV